MAGASDGLTRRQFVARAAGVAATVALPAPSALKAAGSGSATDPRLRALDKAVRGPVLTPAQPRYDERSARLRRPLRLVHPLAVVQPLDENDVSPVVQWARKTGVHIAAQLGRPQLRRLLDDDRRRRRPLQARRACASSARHAVVGPAARLGNIYNTLGAHGLAIPAGTCPSVGIGGHALGGGFGLASRAWGLASDNLVSVRIVTADGQILVADAKHHGDLYWACRGGGGGNFGIVTRLTFRTHPVTQGSYFIATWPWAQVEQVLARFLAWAPAAPDALGSLCRLAAGPGRAERCRCSASSSAARPR